MLKLKPILLAISATFTLSACQLINMVDVKQVEYAQLSQHERQSILTDQKLSQHSQNTLLLIQPKTTLCIQNPESCMQSLLALYEISDEDKLSTGSELYLAHALFIQNKQQCHLNPESQKNIKTFDEQQYKLCFQTYLEALNQSIRYSYAYLFATSRQPQQRLFNNRQIQVKDFYNQAIAHLINTANQRDPQQHQHKQLLSQEIAIGESQYHLDISAYPNLNFDQIEQFISTYNLQFVGLNSLSRRDGFGSEFVIKMKSNQKKEPIIDYATQKINIFDHPNVSIAEYLPATVLVEPKYKQSIPDILASKEMVLKAFDPNQHNQINVAGHALQLAANFSAPYGLWLANAKLGSQGLNTLLKQEQQFVSPKLFMLEPYNPNKKLIIMIHGLASSPEAWISISNDLMADERLRQNYQIWQVFYSTNMPILENRYQIYHLLTQSIQQVQQKHPQITVKDSVLIGHSMGGVISRLLVSDSQFSQQAKTYLQQKCNSCKTQNLDLDYMIQGIEKKLNMQPFAPVSRAVFIAAPFRGTQFADRWFTKLARKTIKLPLDVIHHGQQNVQNYFKTSGQQVDSRQLFKELYQNGADDLSPHSMFMHLTQDSQIKAGLPYHIIVGNLHKSNEPSKMTDGIVPYYSASLEQATSEKIIAGSHSIQYNPEAVLELRRILYLHLAESKQP